MKNYEEKKIYLHKKQSERCAISGRGVAKAFLNYDFGANKIDLHHGCHKTKWRAKKFYLFIDSLLNLRLCYHSEHLAWPLACRISDHQAEKYQNFLMSPAHWKWRIFVNEARWPDGDEDQNKLLNKWDKL